MKSSRRFRFSAMLPILAAALVGVSTFAGAQMRTLKIEGSGEVFMLKELGAIISEGENGLAVLMVLPPEQRAKAYRDIDLQEGDVIMMFNGKRAKTSVQIEEAYDGLKIGDEIKLGIKRDKDMMIATLAKANPDDLPGQMKIMKSDSCPASADMTLAGVGLMLTKDNGKLIIDDVLVGLADKFTGPLPEKGDVILKIQGTPISQPDQLSEIFDKIKTGEKVDMVLGRGDQEISTGFAKPDCTQGKPMIIRKQG